MDMWTALTIIVTAIGIAVSVSTRKILVARAQARAALDTKEVLARLEAIDARLARLEQGADANAVEIERLGEAQRYLLRAVAEGGERGTPALPQSESAAG